MRENAGRPRRPEPFPKDFGTRFLLVIGLLLQLLMVAAGLWPAAWLVLRFGAVGRTPGQWVLIILGATLVFNYGYLLGLLLLRIVIPYPKEGAYPVVAGQRVHKQVVIFTLNLLLLKSRFEPPWAAMFSSVLTRIYPLRPLFIRFFGPRTSTTTPGDTIFCLDPHLVEIGKNVQLGFQCTIAAHLFDNRKLIIRKVVIEDHAAIGGQAGLLPGVRVGHHAVVAGRAHVQPNTVIGPYEYWAGDPARKIRTLASAEQHAAAAEVG
ncbi:MAG: acyltransferase [Phycisphaerae bacterium]